EQEKRKERVGLKRKEKEMLSLMEIGTRKKEGKVNGLIELISIVLGYKVQYPIQASPFQPSKFYPNQSNLAYQTGPYGTMCTRACF
ncbi:hypothetical protein GBA52_012455, partial [Prunus armeniaca]